ncbi:hypothetical protein LTR85_002695 [Meristemomyces frigidus]|nr:hypothetical protein LTR85_002695 [Meristemomyces frigidus]
MAPITSLLFALASTAATVAALGNSSASLGSYIIPSISSHQPTGAVDGDVNYYHMSLTVNATTSGSESGYCHATWSDNVYTSQDAYSDSVATGSWIKCDSSSANYGDEDSEFAFQLFPYFSIGNYSFQYLLRTTSWVPTLVVAGNIKQLGRYERGKAFALDANG